MLNITDEETQAIKRKYGHLFQGKSESYHAGMVRAIAAAEHLSNAVNEIGFDHKTFAKVLASDHRTLQQNTMRTFISFVEELDKAYDDGFYDERNRAACALAKDIMKHEVYLPNI